MLKPKSLLTFVIAILFNSQGVMAADIAPGAQNFRFALPDNYAVVEHQVNPVLQGGSATFSPQIQVGKNATETKIIRLQTYLADYYPAVLSELGVNKPKEFLNTILETQLTSACAKFTVNLGKVRNSDGVTRVNWWTSCKLNEQESSYQIERGRMFLSAAGGYFISHINQSTNKHHAFSKREVKWFDKYIYNSGFCTAGKNCGQEGALVAQLFTEK
ncbi:hypothetical protein [Neptunomonas sp.]|uniref:hypothetical protein n=1 Tax=Neptunomonas sp. TaxID=1971898 RepID=UPI0025E922F3|nr:hypothetical protein [Neptunomonas sp.]